MNQRVKPNENSPRRKLNQQSTTGEQTSPSRESDQCEQRSPSREYDPRENYPHNDFDYLTIDESEVILAVVVCGCLSTTYCCG